MSANLYPVFDAMFEVMLETSLVCFSGTWYALTHDTHVRHRLNSCSGLPSFHGDTIFSSVAYLAMSGAATKKKFRENVPLAHRRFARQAVIV